MIDATREASLRNPARKLLVASPLHERDPAVDDRGVDAVRPLHDPAREIFDMLMPDHVPQIDGRDPSGVAFAYCYGYIQALLDALAPRTVVGRSDRLATARPATGAG